MTASPPTDADLHKLEVLFGNIELIARSTPSLLNRRITLGGVIGSQMFFFP